MAAKGLMLGAWMNINNRDRTTDDDLNLTVGGTILLSEAALRALAEQLLTVTIKVIDSDDLSDDLLLTDASFQVAVHDTNPTCFHTGVIVPH